MALMRLRLSDRDVRVAVTLTAALAAPANVMDAHEIVSMLQDVMTALAERGGAVGVGRAALEIAAKRARK